MTEKLQHMDEKDLILDENTDLTANESSVNEHEETNNIEEISLEKLEIINNIDIASETETKEKEVSYISEEIEILHSSDDSETDDEDDTKLTEGYDFSDLHYNELLLVLKEIIEKDDYVKSIRKVNSLKDEFNFKIRKQKEDTRNKFIADGSDIKDFVEPKLDIENDFNNLLNTFYNKRNELKEKEEITKKENLKLKYEIIEGIKNLINKPESFETTYNNFKSLQQKWREIGIVPKNEVKLMWDEYHREVENFYKYLEINKVLRDLDLKKNLDEKIILCEKAEELLTVENISEARKSLQTLHELWKETGPISKEKKDEVWDRFKSATISINKKFQDHFDKIKEQQDKNLESKDFLCQKAEEYAQNNYITQKDWKEASVQVIKLQQLWKEIGYVPQNKNTEIYQRFRNSCDVFFEKIRDFYSKSNEERDNNMQLKTDLCIQAESLQESTEWKKTSEIYKNLQNEWKKIGPVSQKHSDAIWQRFRKACNIFFDRKKDYFSNRKTNEAENLEKKKALIEEVKNYQVTNTPEDLEKLKEFQRLWTEIGFVPFEQKDSVYDEYRAAIGSHFEKLNIDKSKQEEMKFNEKLENFKGSRNSKELVNSEVVRIQNKIEKLETDIKILENNLGFFANSKNAENMINEFNKKIEVSKKEVDNLKKQISQLLKAE
jgi:hypothetical protein